MKPKPLGAKYRNLYAYRGSVWYERLVAGRRLRLDLETESWGEAAERRDGYELLKGIPARLTRRSSARVPTLAEFAERYLEGDVAHLAATTRRDRSSYLAEDGLLLRHLGGLRLDEIDPAALRGWWRDAIETPWTGRERERAPTQAGDGAALLERARLGARLREGPRHPRDDTDRRV
jgi:hypothetical protein